MIYKEITKKLPEYQQIMEVYDRIFPKSERMPHFILLLLSKRKGVRFLAFYDGENFCGFTYLIENKEVVYILYLGVNDKAHSKGYGSKILDWVSSEYKTQMIVLNMEEVCEKVENYEQRLRRKAFYVKNGYKDAEYTIKMHGEVFDTFYLGEKFSVELFNKLIKSISFGFVKIKLNKKI